MKFKELEMATKKEVLMQAKDALAKKKAKKQVSSEPDVDLGRKEIWGALNAINLRIDNIVAAHEFCKSLKGL